MNERVKELASQLGPVATIGNWGRVEWADNVYPQLGDRLYAAIDLEKFAELIVRECMMLVEGFESTQEVALDEYVDYEASVVLKEHFGV